MRKVRTCDGCLAVTEQPLIEVGFDNALEKVALKWLCTSCGKHMPFKVEVDYADIERRVRKAIMIEELMNDSFGKKGDEHLITAITVVMADAIRDAVEQAIKDSIER